MKAINVGIIAAIILGVLPPALAEPIAGEVQEIIIKIKTEDGEKWYKLGKDLEPINIKEGDYVRFDYADDAIESITTESRSEKMQGAQEQSQPE